MGKGQEGKGESAHSAGV